MIRTNVGFGLGKMMKTAALIQTVIAMKWNISVITNNCTRQPSNEDCKMNFEIMRMYYFAERVKAKKRWLQARVRIQAKKKGGRLGDMAMCHKSVIMKNNCIYIAE